MKNSAMRRYVTWLIVYTAVYIVVLLTLDVGFNGMVVDFLAQYLDSWMLYYVQHYRVTWGLMLYIAGLLVFSVLYVVRLGNLLNMASRAIGEEEPNMLETRCPEELQEFHRMLKEFKYDLRMNEQARRLAEQQKNDLVVYLAHDLKTPLTSVIGYLSLLEEASNLPLEQRAKYIGIALDKAYRLEQLINEFFDITRLNLQTIPTQKQPLNFTMFLSQILIEFAPMFEERQIQVVSKIEPKLTIAADGDKLARVFDNLFRNALNYSYDHTEMICTAHQLEDQVEICVRNKGDQIPPEKLAHIFDKFYRLYQSRQSKTGGAGLGLAIAKQIIELHDGTIQAECQNGTIEFKIHLPVGKH